MNILNKNKAFFLFLLKFAGTYLLLSFIYWLYLSQYDAAKFEPDGMTRMVTAQVKHVMLFFGEDVAATPHPAQASYKFYIKDRIVMRIVEGCNAISVMILFVSFIAAFSTTVKRTVLFCLAGIIIIHVLNIIRIMLFGWGLYHYKEYGPLMHDIIFPLFIYGVVFILWVLWVTKFTGNAKKTIAAQ